MKKIILFFAAVLFATASYGQTQKQIGIGIDINLAYISKLDNLTRTTYGINVNLFGIHFDYSVAPAAHRRSTDVGVWGNESRILLTNIGYRINIFKKLTLTPIVGYVRAEIGAVNGWDWAVDNEGIVNEFITEKRLDLFNFGCRLDYPVYESNVCNVVIGATVQRYDFGVNVGVNFKI